MASESPELENPFETTSDTTVTRRDRIERTLDVWVYAPFKIMWDDMRTRVGLLIVLIYALMGTVGVVVIPAPSMNEGPVLLPAFQSIQYPLGTDKFGQDLFEAIVHATPAMLKMIIAGSVFTTAVATIVGTVSGYKGGETIDTILMSISDIAMTIPGLPLIIVIAIALEPRNPFVVGIILTINAWAGLARSLRSQVLAVREDAYIEASALMGVPTPKIIAYDVLPNLMPYIVINFVQSARNVIFASVGLYFLGLLPFTTLNWGVMMNMARQSGALRSPRALHWLLVPMIAITLLTFGLILLAQGMDRVFNPRVRARHASTVEDVGTEH